MNAHLDIPLELRLLALFALGVCVGGAVNWAVYSLCFFPRPISPWSHDYPRRGTPLWLDRVPLFGWLRERPAGQEFAEAGWLRPFAVELLAGLAFAGLYVWEIDRLRLVFPPLGGVVVATTNLLTVLHGQYLAHVVLLGFMIATSLIDLDEQTIPDALTVPGTLLGLTLSVILPASLASDTVWLTMGAVQFPLEIASPNRWPVILDGLWGLILGLACLAGWCAALAPYTWYARHGWRRALRLSLARVSRERATMWLLGIFALGAVAMTGVWWKGEDTWPRLLTSLVGLAVGGGLVWSVRIIGSAALGREAMGFGDVTLMAMIGAYLGWQPALMAFFLAPFAGLLLGLVKLILRGEQALPYGPFLCLGALVTIVHWVPLWNWARPMFAFGLLVPGAMVACLLLTGLLLLILRSVRGAVGRMARRG